jgi:hypothetical protein
MDEGTRRRLWQWVGGGLVLLLLAGAVVGLSVGGPSSSNSKAGLSVPASGPATGMDLSQSQGTQDAANGAVASPGMAASAAGAGGAASSSAPAPAVGVPGVGQPKIVKNVTLSLEVKKGGYRQAFDAAAAVAASHGGFVLSSDSNVQRGEVSTGSLVLRVPADAFDAVRAELSRLGSVKDEHISGEDVSGQLVDLDARIRSLQAQEDAIRTLMSKARTVGETLDIQNQLTQVRQQIEQLSGEKARLDNAADLATVRVQLAEPGAAVTPEPKPVAHHSALRRSFTLAARGAVTVLAGTIIVLGWVIPLALLALLGWGGWRLVRRGRRTSPAVTG